ncbi:MAG: hypothetical protein RLZZ399_1382 [Verrucomicrobiota bacterium]
MVMKLPERANRVGVWKKRGIAAGRWALCAVLCLGAGCAGGGVGRSGGASAFAKAEESLDFSRVRLLEGVITRDWAAVAQLLTPDFTWREDEAPLEETPADYWDRHKLWGELERLIREPVAKLERMRVAPKAAVDPGYTGARLAWRKVGDEWRLAYFYAGADPLPQSR